MLIFIKNTAGKRHTLDVEPYYTIGDLLAMIENYEVRIDFIRYFLIFNSKPMFQEFKTLEQCGIKRDSILIIARGHSFRGGGPSIAISLPNGISIITGYNGYETVDWLKDLVNERENIPKERQILIWNDHILENDKKLKYYHFPLHTSIALELKDNVTIITKK